MPWRPLINERPKDVRCEGDREIQERIPEAEELLKYAFSGIPQTMRPYQPLGRLHLDLRSPNRWRYKQEARGEVEHGSYFRELELSRALHRVRFCRDGVWHEREAFASYPAQVMVVHLTADQPGQISFSCFLERDRFSDSSERALLREAVAGEAPVYAVLMKGNEGEGGVRFAGGVAASVFGGTAATYWVLGGAWLSLHIWQHYQYTKDREWLASLGDAALYPADGTGEAFDVAVGCAAFEQKHCGE